MVNKIKDYFLEKFLQNEKDTLRIANVQIIFYITVFSILLLLILQVVYLIAGSTLLQQFVGVLSLSLFISILLLLRAGKGVNGVSIALLVFSTAIFIINLYLYPSTSLVNGLLLTANIIFAFNLLNRLGGFIFSAVHLVAGLFYFITLPLGFEFQWIAPVNQTMVEMCTNYIMLMIIVVLLILHYQNAHKNSAKKLINYIEELSKKEKDLKRLLDITSYQNSQLKNFTYIVSHNVRSHSSNFSGLMTLLSEAKTIEEQEQYKKLLFATASKLDETLTNLNEILTITENVSKPKVMKNLKREISRTLDILSGMIRKDNIEINIHVPEALEINVIPSYLESIILNLLSNAIKYRSKKRTCRIDIEFRDEENYSVLAISDNGLGIDLDKHGEKLFGMYKTFHHNEDARGIGLFITKSHIEAMNGKIEVESKVDQGTKFEVYFSKE